VARQVRPTASRLHASIQAARLERAAETRGTWSAQPVPGLAAVHSRNSAIHAVSCQPHRGCSSIGDYLAQDRRLFTSSRG
jgi:hypothetical protein